MRWLLSRGLKFDLGRETAGARCRTGDTSPRTLACRSYPVIDRDAWCGSGWASGTASRRAGWRLNMYPSSAARASRKEAGSCAPTILLLIVDEPDDVTCASGVRPYQDARRVGDLPTTKQWRSTTERHTAHTASTWHMNTHTRPSKSTYKRDAPVDNQTSSPMHVPTISFSVAPVAPRAGVRDGAT